MKQPKKLSREQKEIVSNNNLNADQWMLVEELEFYLKIMNKGTSKIKMITRFPKKLKKGVQAI